jgi:hypothetical protein
MEKTIPSCHLIIAEEEEEINPESQETWYGETLTLRTRSTEKKNLLKTVDPHSLRHRGTSGGEGGGAAAATTALSCETQDLARKLTCLCFLAIASLMTNLLVVASCYHYVSHEMIRPLYHF